MNTPTVSHPVPPESLETSRLVLRCPRLEDVPMIHSAQAASIDSLLPWMDWAKPGQSLESCYEATAEAIEIFRRGEDFRYHAHDKHSGALYVCSGLHRIDWRVPRVEIGYWCHAAYTGQGYVSETVRALATLAFEQLAAARVEIRCNARNLASARVAERCGFSLEAVLHNNERTPDDTLGHTRIYALTALEQLRQK